MPRPQSQRAPVWQLLACACAATAVAAILVLTVAVHSNGGLPSLLSPGSSTPGAEVLQHDFPSYRLPQRLAGSAQSTYVIAREPMHLADASRSLDRPRYRMQQILLPLLAWVFHPTGGGTGLIVAMWLIAAAGVVLSALGAALLAHELGASAKGTLALAILVPLLPSSIAVLGGTTADGLMLGLVLLALACDAANRARRATVLAVLAVFAHPVALLVLVGWTVWRGRSALARMVIAPASLAAGWWVVLRVWIASSPEPLRELAPVVGLVRSLRAWGTGDDRVAAAVFAITVYLGLTALAIQGLRSPLGPTIVLEFATLAMLSVTSLAGDWNAIRATGPLLVIAAIAVTVPSHRRAASTRS